MRGLLAALAVLFVAPSAVAADAPVPKSAAFEACIATTHGATFPLLHCYAAEMQLRDDAMTAAYDAALAAARDPRTKVYLARSQTAWSDYLDAWCEARVPRSGSHARLMLMECRLEETVERTAALKALFAR